MVRLAAIAMAWLMMALVPVQAAQDPTAPLGLAGPSGQVQSVTGTPAAVAGHFLRSGWPGMPGDS